MYIKEKMYKNRLIQILYPDEGYLLQHKETKLIYGSISLKDNKKQKDYIEIKTSEEETNE